MLGSQNIQPKEESGMQRVLQCIPELLQGFKDEDTSLDETARMFLS